MDKIKMVCFVTFGISLKWGKAKALFPVDTRWQGWQVF